MSRIALIGKNSIGYINALLDIWNNGDCAVLLDWRIPFPVIMEMMKEANAYSCVIEKGLFDNMLNKKYPSISFVPFDPINKSVISLPKYIYDKFREDYSKNEAVVIFSSGTTGKSKGIILSHFAINTNADAIINYMRPTLNDCIYIAKSLSHSSTLTGELLVALKSKMSAIIAPTIVPPRFILNSIRNFGVTIICLNPTLLSLIADEYDHEKYELPTLKTIYVSGSILSDKIYDKAHAVFHNVFIYNVYGLSEAGPRVTAQRSTCCKSNSVGKPISNVEVKIADETGRLVLNGQHGYIHVKTPSIFDGYIVGGEKHPSLYGEWYNTGDIGYFDIDDELHVVNRADELIIINSHKIYPSSVERIVENIQGVHECVVFGIDLAEGLALFCVYTGKELDPISIKRELSSKLMVHEIPRYFLQCEKIDKSPNGKPAYSLIRNRAEEWLNHK